MSCHHYFFTFSRLSNSFFPFLLKISLSWRIFDKYNFFISSNIAQTIRKLNDKIYFRKSILISFKTHVISNSISSVKSNTARQIRIAKSFESSNYRVLHFAQKSSISYTTKPHMNCYELNGKIIS